MRTVRRLYFYLVAFISLETVIWGTISLLRTLFKQLPYGGTADLLASGLSLVLVGLPIFLIHWLAVERDARQDTEEHGSSIRALFLYGVRLATLIPLTYSALAVLNRTVLAGFGLDASNALAGAGQTLMDNLVAFFINLAAFGYFHFVVQKDWEAGLSGDHLAGMRRLFRYIWMLYNLVQMVWGIQSVLKYVFDMLTDYIHAEAALLANGISMLVLSTVLWVLVWRLIQGSLNRSEERFSGLRLGVLYLVALIGAVTVLVSLGGVLDPILRALLGEVTTLQNYFKDNGWILSIAIPLGMVWAYYGNQLEDQFRQVSDRLEQAGQRRLYFYILSLLGCAASFTGTLMLGWTAVDLLLGKFFYLQSVARSPLAVSLSILVVSLPVWLQNWKKVQTETGASDELGEHSRRSIIRKGYLYLLIFLAVIGVMISAGALLYFVFNSLLQGNMEDFWHTLLLRLQTLGWVTVWLVYHLRILILDGKHAQRVLGERQMSFKVALLDDGRNDFAAAFCDAMHRQAPGLSVQVQDATQPLVENLSECNALLLPSGLAFNPTLELRTWLEKYPGRRLVIPVQVEDWIILGFPHSSVLEQASSAAQAVRQMAEGQVVRMRPPTNAWMVAGYVLAGIVGLQVLFLILSILASLIWGQ